MLALLQPLSEFVGNHPTLTLLPPLAVIPFILLFGEKQRNLREAAIIIAGILLLAFNLPLLNASLNGMSPSTSAHVIFGNLTLQLRTEPLGALFGVLASFLWIITTIYSIGYMRAHKELNQTRFYTCFALAIAAVMLAAHSANLLTLFVAYEIITLSTIPLVTHAGTAAARRAGKIYVLTLMGSSIGLLLPAIIWIYSLTGSTDFVAGGLLADSIELGQLSITALGILLALIVFGTAKAALMPFHGWLPNAMVAPTPVSALLHAVAVVKTGVFLLLKVIIYIIGTDSLTQGGNNPVNTGLIYFTGGTIVLASLIAMTKDNLKARLAYSTISQLAYIILAALIATELSLMGGGLHIISHAFGKITLFFCAGAILVSLHKKNVSDLDGVGKKIPITMIGFLIGSLSIIGLPPTGGTWSKLLIAQGSIDASLWFPVAVLLISSLLNIAYLLPIPIRAFFKAEKSQESSNDQQHGSAEPLSCQIAIVVTSISCIVLFFFPDSVLQALQAIEFTASTN
ncbi:MAG: proton-conducting transporter membrane subunit [Arenicella sp.]